MINLGITAARITVVGCVAFIGYTFGRVHGSNHSTRAHSLNLMEATNNMVTLFIDEAKIELSEMERRYNNFPVPAGVEFQTLGDDIIRKEEYIANLERILKR